MKLPQMPLLHKHIHKIKWFSFIFSFNTAFAALLWLIFQQQEFQSIFIIWQVLGLFTFFFVSTSYLIFKPTVPAHQLTVTLISMMVSAFLIVGILWFFKRDWFETSGDINFMILNINMMGALIISARFSKKIFKWLVFVLSLTACIAFFYWYIENRMRPFVHYHVAYQSIGLNSFLLVLATRYILKKAHPVMKTIASFMTMAFGSITTTLLLFFFADDWPANTAIIVCFFTGFVPSVGGSLLLISAWWKRLILEKDRLDTEIIQVHLMEKKLRKLI